MESEWPLLALIGSAATGLGTAAGTAATGLGTLASGALGSTAAGGALRALGSMASPVLGSILGTPTGGGGAGGAPPPTASSVSTANLPPGSGGQQLSTPPPPSGASSGGGGGFFGSLFGGGGQGNQIGASTEQGPVQVPAGATDMSQASAMPPAQSPLQRLSGMGLNLVAGGPYGGAPGQGFLSSLPGALYQRALSSVSGFPMGASGQGFGTDLGQALHGRILSSLMPQPGGGAQSPQMEALMRLLLQQQGQPARQLPIYGNLPGYG